MIYVITYFLRLLRFFTLLGLPAGCPNDFFSLIFFAFSEDDISPDVFGVLLDTLLLGLQYGTPLPSPFLRPQALPVLTSTHFSLNQRLSDAPFLVLRTAITFSFFPCSFCI